MPVVIAHLQVKPGREAEAEAALAEVVAATHREEGCETYALHRDTEDPLSFVFVESWASDAALDSHRAQPHMTAFAAVAGDLLENPPRVQILEPRPHGDAGKGVL